MVKQKQKRDIWALLVSQFFTYDFESMKNTKKTINLIYMQMLLLAYLENSILSYMIFLYWQLQSTVKQKQRRNIPALLVSRIFMYCCASVKNTKKRPCTHPFTAVISPKTLKNMADSSIQYYYSFTSTDYRQHQSSDHIFLSI